MIGHGVPSIYASATHLDADSNAQLALARAQWEALEKRSPAQAREIRQAQECRGGHCVRYAARGPTFDALVCKGFVVPATRLLTPIGESLRAAAIYTQEPRP